MNAWFFTPQEWQAIRISLLVAGVAVGVTLPLGVAAGWLLARRHFAGKTLVETLVMLPLVLPPVVTGYLLLLTFGRNGWLGRHLDAWLGLRLVFTWQGAALAAAVVSFPLMVRAIRLTIESVDPRLEQTARTLGAGRLDAFLTVTLPLARNGVIAGAILAFARAVGEFGATIAVAGSIPGRTRTIALEVFNMMDSPRETWNAWRLVVASIIIAAAALAAGEYLQRHPARGARARRAAP